MQNDEERMSRLQADIQRGDDLLHEHEYNIFKANIDIVYIKLLHFLIAFLFGVMMAYQPIFIHFFIIYQLLKPLPQALYIDTNEVLFMLLGHHFYITLAY